jgi:hypothetical protein
MFWRRYSGILNLHIRWTWLASFMLLSLYTRGNNRWQPRGLQNRSGNYEDKNLLHLPTDWATGLPVLYNSELKTSLLSSLYVRRRWRVGPLVSLSVYDLFHHPLASAQARKDSNHWVHIVTRASSTKCNLKARKAAASGSIYTPCPGAHGTKESSSKFICKI